MFRLKNTFLLIMMFLMSFSSFARVLSGHCYYYKLGDIYQAGDCQQLTPQSSGISYIITMDYNGDKPNIALAKYFKIVDGDLSKAYTEFKTDSITLTDDPEKTQKILSDYTKEITYSQIHASLDLSTEDLELKKSRDAKILADANLKKLKTEEDDFAKDKKRITDKLESGNFDESETMYNSYKDELDNKTIKIVNKINEEKKVFEDDNKRLDSIFEKTKLIAYDTGKIDSEGNPVTATMNLYTKTGDQWGINPDLISKKVLESHKAAYEDGKTNISKYEDNLGYIKVKNKESHSVVSSFIEDKKNDEKLSFQNEFDKNNENLLEAYSSFSGKLNSKKLVECEQALIDCNKADLSTDRKNTCKEKALKLSENVPENIIIDSESTDPCNKWAQYESEYDPEAVEAKDAIAMEREGRDNSSGSSQDISISKESVNDDLREVVSDSFSPARCGNLITENKDDILKYGTVDILDEEVRQLGAEARAPEAFVIPNQCMDTKLFKPKGYGLFTDYSKNIAEQMTLKSVRKVCSGAGFYQEENSELTCNSLLRHSKSCQKGKESETGTFTIAKKIFKKKEVCQEYFWNEFKGCMGLQYEKIDMMADSYEKAEPSIPGNISRAKKAIESEIGRQFGTCISFREVSRDVQSSGGDRREWEGPEEVTSFKGHKCQRNTPWTMDYFACKAVVNTYNSFAIGDQARGLANQGWTMSESRKIQKSASAEMAQGNQLNAGLNAQISTLKHKKNQETGNLVFFGAQAATLSTVLASYPTPNSISKKCDGEILESGVNSSHYCLIEQAWDVHPEVKNQELFVNQDVKKQMWFEVMQAGSQAVLAALKSSQYGKMAGDINMFKDAFNGLEDKSTTKDSQIELSYCKFNPTAPTCRTSGPRVTRDGGFKYGSITSQNAGGGAFNISGNDEAFGEYDEDEDSAAKRAAIQDLGGMIDNTSAGSFDNKFDKIGAGSFAKKGLGGGGGSGGGAAGGGGGGGGGAAKGKAGGQNKFSVSKSGGAGSFQSGSGGKAGFGTGGSSSKKNSSKNPFSNMFGSKKGRNVASQGNNDIAPANSALFDKISKRYGKIAAENRLINLQGLSK